MKKYNKMDYINILILFVFFIMLIIYLIGANKLYIYNMDYANQHFLIPEYFRTIFYKTKDLFPSFAFNLGLGQNIYNFSYYGLFNPIIMLSYLLPFIKMIDFIEFYSISSILISSLLFYVFISRYTKDKTIRLISSFTFLLSSPLIFHSHRHIMFIDYMPFLLICLILIEKYINYNKKIGLILTLSLLILTSYFFSIPSIIVILIYYLFLLIKDNKLNKKCIKIIPIIMISILLTSFLLFPTFKAILNSRFDINESTNILSLLIPNFSFENILYSAYTLGMSSIFILSISNALASKEKKYKFLGAIFILLTFFPIINYILNGFMYINGKVFIPFIPLACLLITKFLSDIKNRNINIKSTILITLIISILGCLKFKFYYIFIADLLITISIVLITLKTSRKKLLYLLLIPLFIICIFLNQKDSLMNKDIKEVQYNEEITSKMKQAYELDKNIYRTVDMTSSDPINLSNDIRNINEYKSTMYSSLTNKNYKNFNWNIFKLENSYRNDSIYVGNKYLIGNTNMQGFIKNRNFYVNNDAFSIGYSNNKLMSSKDFNKLSFPYSNEALMNYTIIDKDVQNNYKSNIKEINIEKKDYKFNLEKDTNYKIKASKQYKNKIIFIKFDMKYNEKCPAKDTYITINGISNKLTCKGWKYHNKNTSFEYVISDSFIDTFDITIGKGIYEIENVKVYELDYDYIKNIKSTHSEFIFDKEKTKADILEGSINVKENGYFSISIPYDEGYTIYVDGKKKSYEKLNTSFIGFNISKGYHNIKIVYEAPWLKIGKIFTIIGIVLFIIILIKEKGVRKNEKNINDSTLL